MLKKIKNIVLSVSLILCALGSFLPSYSMEVIMRPARVWKPTNRHMTRSYHTSIQYTEDQWLKEIDNNNSRIMKMEKNCVKTIKKVDVHLGHKSNNILSYIKEYNNLLKTSKHLNRLSSKSVTEIRKINYKLRNTYGNFEDRIKLLEDYEEVNFNDNQKFPNLYESIESMRDSIKEFRESIFVKTALE